jgi:hypothetical protein
MITPTQQITIPSQSADALWVTNIQIIAPNPSSSIRAVVNITPYNSASGSMFPALRKTVNFPDIASASQQYPVIATAMESILSAVQAYVTSSSLF